MKQSLGRNYEKGFVSKMLLELFYTAPKNLLNILNMFNLICKETFYLVLEGLC